jgi:anti-anti-sigma factor
MALRLSIIGKDAGVVHLAGHGEATGFQAGTSSPFEQILGGQWAGQRVLLNMEFVSYIDSAGIGWLIGTQKQFRGAGGFLVMHSVQPAVKNVLNLLKIERVVPTAADAEGGRVMLALQAKAVHAA